MKPAQRFTKNLNMLYERAGGEGSGFVTGLAKKAGLTRKAIHDLLAGGEPRLGNLAAISEAVGISIQELLAETDPPERKPVETENDIRLACISLILGIDSRHLPGARAYLAGLASKGK